MILSVPWRENPFNHKLFSRFPATVDAMEDLPDHLVVDILRRLTDSADLARSRVACRAFNSLSRHVKSLNLLCSSSRYHRSRSPATRSITTPFKSVVRASVCGSIGCGAHLESIFIGVEDAPELSYDNVGDDSGDDLYLTDVGFLREWLPWVCEGLRELSISDFWAQSCWRRSDVLGFVSSCCEFVALHLSLIHRLPCGL